METNQCLLLRIATTLPSFYKLNIYRVLNYSLISQEAAFLHLMAVWFIKITLNMVEDTKVYSRYAYQTVRHKNLTYLIYLMQNLISMGTFKINAKIILYRLPETQWYLFDRHANGAMQWINGSLSLWHLQQMSLREWLFLYRGNINGLPRRYLIENIQLNLCVIRHSSWF